MADLYNVVLIKGSSHSRGGRKFVRGISQPMPETDPNFDYYKNNGAYSVSLAGGSRPTRRPEAGRPEEPQRPVRRTREDIRAARSVPVEKSEEGEGHEEPEAPADLSRPALLELANTRVDDKKLSKSTLVDIARKLGAAGPDGEAPSEDLTKAILGSWIRSAQTRIVASSSSEAE